MFKYNDNFFDDEEYMLDEETLKALRNDNDISDIINIQNLAEEQYKIILEEIKAFEQQLDDEHEVALMMTNFGVTVTLYIKKIGYSNPSLIFYYGIDSNGNRCQLIQHISQINFLLKAAKKLDPISPPHRIGFGN